MTTTISVEQILGQYYQRYYMYSFLFGVKNESDSPTDQQLFTSYRIAEIKTMDKFRLTAQTIKPVSLSAVFNRVAILSRDSVLWANCEEFHPNDFNSISLKTPQLWERLNRRMDFRVPYPVNVEVVVGGRHVRAQIIDISAGGIKVVYVSKDKPVLRSSVRVSLPVVPKVELSGIIVRERSVSYSTNEIVVTWSFRNTQMKDALRRFLAELERTTLVGLPSPTTWT